LADSSPSGLVGQRKLTFSNAELTGGLVPLADISYFEKDPCQVYVLGGGRSYRRASMGVFLNQLFSKLT
jgi:hypothetical protein